ncbi:MAG: ion channel [Verrucomicrobiota bacterium]
MPSEISQFARRHAISIFLAFILFFFAAAPVIDSFPGGRHLEGVLATVMLAAAVPAVGGGRRSLVATAALSAPIFFGYWFQLHRKEGSMYLIFIVAFLVFLCFIIGRLLYFIRWTPRVTSEVLSAGISIYLLLGILWAAGYALVGRVIPGDFANVSVAAGRMQGFEALYFSFVTLTTVGYGDILPVAPVARMLAMMEAMTGTLYLAVLVSRLVSLHASAATPADAPSDPPANRGEGIP